MYDSPNYQVFGKLFDQPGWVYENETTNGIINDFLNTPDVDESKLLNITLASAIERCQQNEATFSVFQFERIVNVSHIFDVEHEKLDKEIEVGGCVSLIELKKKQCLPFKLFAIQ